MFAALVGIAVLVAVGAAVAGASSTDALRANLRGSGGDFGSRDVAGPDAELRALIAAGDAAGTRRRN